MWCIAILWGLWHHCEELFVFDPDASQVTHCMFNPEKVPLSSEGKEQQFSEEQKPVSSVVVPQEETRVDNEAFKPTTGNDQSKEDNNKLTTYTSHN